MLALPAMRSVITTLADQIVRVVIPMLKTERGTVSAPKTAHVKTDADKSDNLVYRGQRMIAIHTGV